MGYIIAAAVAVNLLLFASGAVALAHAGGNHDFAQALLLAASGAALAALGLAGSVWSALVWWLR